MENYPYPVNENVALSRRPRDNAIVSLRAGGYFSEFLTENYPYPVIENVALSRSQGNKVNFCRRGICFFLHLIYKVNRQA